MDENSSWKECMKEITQCGGAVFSNKALRKYFKKRYCKNSQDKSYIDLADVYGQIVSQGVYFEKQYIINDENMLFASANYIAEELSLPIRRVRDSINMLVKSGLLVKVKKPGWANRYKPAPGRLTELTKDFQRVKTTIDDYRIYEKEKEESNNQNKVRKTMII